jgi:hypothetical protein
MGPLGQAVKTPPFHGGNTGSNPVGVIKKSVMLKCITLRL